MTAQLNQILARQRTAEFQRIAEQTPHASELQRAGAGEDRAPQHAQAPRATGLTLRGHHLAKLDRFLGQAQRAALRAEREFDGVTVEINAEGVVTVHAIGMTSILL